ncbi:hypothetical protein [Amycolatopsis sp. A1MSW2902]|uniref:hypothetical protein n=1 Tax=Amycolatopsis sp. A1MSW2902 TaxID=687413 RepID=UPI00307F6553
MPRNRASAKKAGSLFERQVADYLAHQLADDRIDRRVRSGAKDRGDIAGVRIHGQRVVLECKNTTRWDIAGWLRETDIERGNDDALAGLVVAKRRGIGDPGQALVMCTLNDLAALLGGKRPWPTTPLESADTSAAYAKNAASAKPKQPTEQASPANP